MSRKVWHRISGSQLVLQGAGPFTLANSGNNFAFLAANTTGAINYQDSNGSDDRHRRPLASGINAGCAR